MATQGEEPVFREESPQGTRTVPLDLSAASFKSAPVPCPAHSGQYRFISHKGAVVLAGLGKGELLRPAAPARLL
jgi:hypothetical protein